jgi:hypothetical protein
MDTQTIALDVNKALTLVNNLLPTLEALGAVSGPVGAEVALGAGAAQIVIPILMDLATELGNRGVISATDQQATLDRFNTVLSLFGQPQWKPSVESPP